MVTSKPIALGSFVSEAKRGVPCTPLSLSALFRCELSGSFCRDIRIALDLLVKAWDDDHKREENRVVGGVYDHRDD